MSSPPLTSVSTNNRRETLVWRYIYLSTLLGVFSGAAKLSVGFSLQIFDIVMIVNLALMASCISIPRWVAWLALCLSASGALGILRGTDTFPLFLKEFLGITVSAIYFATFFRHFRRNLDRVFLTYAKIAYWETVIGILMFLGEYLHTNRYARMQGLFSEPMHYCLLVLPAYYWFAYLCFTLRKCIREFSVISVGMCLAGSSVGFIGIAFGILLLLSRRRRAVILGPLIVGLFIFVIYTLSPTVRIRVDDTMAAATTLDVSGSNASTYALISNIVVTQNVMQVHPVLGNGLGSNVLSHDRYLYNVLGVDEFINSGIGSLNSADADSLVLRSLSELGLVGLIGILWFVFHFRVSGDGVRAAISSAILVGFSVRLLRHGHYFQPEQFFYIQMYISNYQQARREGLTHANRFNLRWTSHTRRVPEVAQGTN